MDVLESQIDVHDPKFVENAAYRRALAAELRERLKIAQQGGGEKYQQRHRKQGKLPLETRRVLGRALSAALNASTKKTEYGVFRM